MTDSTMRIRPKVQTFEAWCYLSPHVARPLWVLDCTRREDDELFLLRRSGKQLIEVGEWLVRDLDAEPMWMSNATLMRLFDAVDENPKRKNT